MFHQARQRFRYSRLISGVDESQEKHPWPGKFRELENSRAIRDDWVSEDAISRELLTWETTQAPSAVPLDGPNPSEEVTRPSGSELGAQDHLRWD